MSLLPPPEYNGGGGGGHGVFIGTPGFKAPGPSSDDAAGVLTLSHWPAAQWGRQRPDWGPVGRWKKTRWTKLNIIAGRRPASRIPPGA